jgi:hypothetical protein
MWESTCGDDISAGLRRATRGLFVAEFGRHLGERVMCSDKPGAKMTRLAAVHINYGEMRI